MSIPVAKVTPRTLGSTLERAPYTLVRLDRVPAPTFPRGLVEWLDRRFPNLITFAAMSRADFPADQPNRILVSSMGPLRRGVENGFYLLEAGYVIGQHGDALRPSSVRIDPTPEEARLRDELRQSPAAAGLRATEFDHLCQLVGYFEPIITRKQRSAGFGDDGWAGSSSWGDTAPPPPPPPPRAPAPAAPEADDPYAVLGLTSGASSEEIKAAYKLQLKLNHPDKVAHLSPALQRFAQQQTLLVMSAYESLSKRHRLD